MYGGHLKRFKCRSDDVEPCPPRQEKQATHTKPLHG
jgi:hypothetical protein